MVVLDRAPQGEAGGNSRFTAGAIRTVYNGHDDILDLMPDLTDEEKNNTDFGSYTEEKFFDDMGTVTDYRTDPDLAEILITQSFLSLKWMQGKGMRFMPLYATGFQNRRQVQVLGWFDGGGLWRRSRVD